MATLLSIRFEYDNCSYYTFIRVRQNENAKEYHVTIMNGRLESLLYGNNVFTEKDGKLQKDMVTSALNDEQACLRMKIGQALEDYLGKAAQLRNSIHTGVPRHFPWI